MIHMLSRFDLKEGIDPIAFAAAFAQLSAEMQAKGLLASSSPTGQRLTDTPMDTDAPDAAGFYSIMSFTNRTQLDAAYEYLLGPPTDTANHEAHDFVKRASKSPIFTCWQDMG